MKGDLKESVPSLGNIIPGTKIFHPQGNGNLEGAKVII